MPGANRSIATTLVTVAIVAGAAFLAFRWAGLGVPALVTKPLPVLCLAALAWRRGGRRRGWLVAGLIVSALGDVILALPGAIGPKIAGSSFLAGLATFLVAHLLYIAWFVALDRHWRLARLAPPLLYTAVLLAFLWPNLGPWLPPVLAYAVAITLMLWRALVAAGKPGDGAGALLRHPAAWGAALFVLSDSLIAVNRFAEPLPAATLLIMLTYWAGQCGIFLTGRRAA